MGDKLYPPALQLRPITQVQIFGQGIVMPATGIGDTGLTPDPSSTVKVQEKTLLTTDRLFYGEVPIDTIGLGARQPGSLPVDMTPTGLQATDIRTVLEIRHDLLEKIRFWQKIGIKDVDKFDNS